MTTTAVKLTERNDIPVLEGWVSLTEVADILGYSRQYVHVLAKKNSFKTLHRLGNSATHVVATSEVAEMQQKRLQAVTENA